MSSLIGWAHTQNDPGGYEGFHQFVHCHLILSLNLTIYAIMQSLRKTNYGNTYGKCMRKWLCLFLDKLKSEFGQGEGVIIIYKHWKITFSNMLILNWLFRHTAQNTKVLHCWPSGPLLLSWISNYIHYTVLNVVAYPFLNFNGAAIEVWEWINNFISLYWACDHLSLLGLNLIHVSKRDHCHCKVWDGITYPFTNFNSSTKSRPHKETNPLF